MPKYTRTYKDQLYTCAKRRVYEGPQIMLYMPARKYLLTAWLLVYDNNEK